MITIVLFKAYVHKAVMEELKRIIDDSNVSSRNICPWQYSLLCYLKYVNA